MNFSQSSRMRAVQSPVIPVVAELIHAHPGTISLGQGVVYYGPPAAAGERIGAFFADPDAHKYGAVHGIPPLVRRFEAKLAAEHGVVPGDARRLVVTAGGNMAFANAVLAVADAGDEVILQTPYYFNHEMAVTMAGCRPVLVPTDARYQLRPDAIAAAVTPRTRAVVTVSPNNPTGAVYPEAALRAVNALCRERGVYHVHDEAYEYFTWGGARHFSPAAIAGSEPHTISQYSLSKSYGFASWRVGAMLVPAHLFDAVRKIQDTVLICPPMVSQYAACGALDAGPAFVRGHAARIAEVRDVVLDHLAALGDRVEAPPTEGAFYCFLRVRTGVPPMELVEALVREHGVAVIPGTAFGVTDGCTIRVSYGSLQKDSVVEGIGRLIGGLRALV